MSRVTFSTASTPTRGGAVALSGAVLVVRCAAGILGRTVAFWCRSFWLTALVGVVLCIAWNDGTGSFLLAASVVLAPGAAWWAAERWQPVALTRYVLAPARRRRWHRSVSRTWPVLSEQVGLGRKVQTRDGAVWRPASYRLDGEGGVVTMTVRTPLGSTRSQVVGAADAIGDALGAHSVTTERVGASSVALHLVMRDALADPESSPEPETCGPVVMGRCRDGSPWVLDPLAGEHIALQGQTGSGKSSTTYTLLGGVAARPDVVVCGVDPSGITLGPWLEGRGGSLVAVGTDDMTRHADALERAVAEMDRRMPLLLAQGVDKLDRFTAEMPALLVVCEEWPAVIRAAKSEDDAHGRKPADRVAPRIQRAKNRLVAEGRKVGVEVLTLAQRMSSTSMDTDERAQYPTRITHRVDTTEAVRMLHDSAAVDMDDMTQWAPGYALAQAPGRPVQVVRMAHTSYSTYRRRVLAGLSATRSLAGRWTPAAAPTPSTVEATVTPEPVDFPSTSPVTDDAPQPARRRQPKQPRRKPADVAA